MPGITGMDTSTQDMIEQRARELAEAAPPLTAQERAELAALLKPGILPTYLSEGSIQ